MATAADIIRRALKQLGVLAAGENASAGDQADCLEELNAMLGTWANERLFVHGITRAVVAVVSGGSSPVTVGEGGTIDGSRPLRIDALGFLSGASGTTPELPLRALTDGEFQSISDKATAGTPDSFWVEWTSPLLKLWLYPVPAAPSRLVFYEWSRLEEFTAATAVELPDGYENALALALALQVAPMFSTEPSGTLLNNAEQALNAIRRTNAPVNLLRSDAPTAGGGFNLVTGGG